MVKPYLPDRGDFVWLDFSPQSGHEQMGRRPALVVSSRAFNRATGMCLACPVTNTRRRNPFRVEISTGGPLSGFIMADQIKSVDFAARQAAFIAHADPDNLRDVLGLLDAIIFQ